MQDINSSNIQKLESMISQARKIAVVTHQKPDGDAMGSCTALYHFLSLCGKDSIRIILNDRYPAYLDFIASEIPDTDLLVFSERPLEAGIILRDSDLIFCLDFNAFSRTDKLEPFLAGSKAEKVLIDHHLNPDRAAFDLSFSETDISSASELLYNVLMSTSIIAQNAENLPLKACTALMTGMTTDTNNFSNSTFPSTLLMASDLLAAGVDRDEIISRIYNQYGENRLRLLGHILKDLLVITDDGVAYIVLDRDTQKRYSVAEGDTEGFVNMPLSIAGVRMSILVKEDEGRIRVSIRSRRGTSANGCARQFFNGGGHENAAGGRLDVPKDIPGIESAAEYIERHTHIYLNGDNE